MALTSRNRLLPKVLSPMTSPTRFMDSSKMNMTQRNTKTVLKKIDEMPILKQDERRRRRLQRTALDVRSSGSSRNVKLISVGNMNNMLHAKEPENQAAWV